MKSNHISDADLLEYLDEPEQRRDVASAIHASADIQARLQTLQEKQLYLRQSFAHYVSPQELVDYKTRQLSPARELVVAAYLRRHPEIKIERDHVPQKQSASPRWIAQLQLPGGVRSTVQDETLAYYVSQLDAQVTLYSAEAGDEIWMLEGYVTLNKVSASGQRVLLHSNDAVYAETTTDSSGFFIFDMVPAGQYEIHVHCQQGIMSVPNIVLAPTFG